MNTLKHEIEKLCNVDDVCEIIYKYYGTCLYDFADDDLDLWRYKLYIHSGIRTALEFYICPKYDKISISEILKKYKIDDTILRKDDIIIRRLIENGKINI